MRRKLFKCHDRVRGGYDIKTGRRKMCSDNPSDIGIVFDDKDCRHYFPNLHRSLSDQTAGKLEQMCLPPSLLGHEIAIS